MIVILIIVVSLIALVILALGLGYLRNRRIQKKIDNGELEKFPDITDLSQMECCGQHEVCEKESLLAAVSKQIEYYNDEELDRFRGVASDQYTSDNLEEFRDILYTMKDIEVAGWVRSLQLRGIELPDELKDEVFLIVGERRFNHQ